MKIEFEHERTIVADKHSSEVAFIEVTHCHSVQTAYLDKDELAMFIAGLQKIHKTLA